MDTGYLECGCDTSCDKCGETRYWVTVASKLNAPPAMARGGETIEPIIVRACCRPNKIVNRMGISSLRP